MAHLLSSSFFFFFNDTATTEIYTLSLHDALPIYSPNHGQLRRRRRQHDQPGRQPSGLERGQRSNRSEEHTSELQSLRHLVCRLLLEKKKKWTMLIALCEGYHTSIA